MGSDMAPFRILNSMAHYDNGSKNVLGTSLAVCGTKPMTGFSGRLRNTGQTLYPLFVQLSMGFSRILSSYG